MKKQPFLAQKVIFNQNLWFLKKILAQNVIKIIFRTFPGTHGVFNCRIKELANPTKLNLVIEQSSMVIKSLLSVDREHSKF